MGSMKVLVGVVGILALAGCGGGGRANVTAGAMPQGGSFTGVWHSPQYGEMNMVQTGSAVVGEYVKDERSGRIQGTSQGDLMRFEWTESRELVSGRPTVTRGRGYFRYTIGDDGAHNILGEWGIDDNETGGGSWNAYRMRNRQPRLSTDSTGGDDGDGDDMDDLGDDLEGDDDTAPAPAGGGTDLGGDDDLGDLDL